MYPNPTSNILNIQHKDIMQINIYDTYGQLISRNKYNFDSQVTLDLSDFEDTMYIVEIMTLEQTFIRRISVVK